MSSVIVESISGGAVDITITDESLLVKVYSTGAIIEGSFDHSELTHLGFTESGHTGFEPEKGIDDNYVTDAEKTKLANLSGVNTGDQNLAPYELKSDKGATNGYAPLVNSKVPIEYLPEAAIERLIIVSDDAHRFALTTVEAQNGDTVKVVSTNLMYFIKDDTKLNIEAGYEPYTASQASAVEWSGVLNNPFGLSEPSDFATAEHLHAGQVITPDGVALDTVSPYVVANAGELGWNSADGTIDLRLLNSTTLQLGQELHIYGKSSENIANGDICQFDGVQGNHILIKKAVQAEIAVNPFLIIGIATHNITANEFGYITWFGKINGVFTTGLALSDLIYYDSASVTTGKWTNVAPVAPYRKILVAVVIKLATGASENGIIMVRPTFGTKFADLDDVDGTDTTIDDTDTIPKKATSGIIKLITWANVKTLLNSAYVTISQTVAQTIGSTTNRILKSWHTDIDANKVITAKITPQTDSTDAFNITKADGSTSIVKVDSTNGNVGIGVVPSVYKVRVQGNLSLSAGSFFDIGNGNVRILDSSFAIVFQNFTGSAVTEKLRIRPNGDLNHLIGAYFYQATSPTADTVNDTRFRNNAGIFIWEVCTVANATKGSGTWVETYRIDTNGFQSAQYDDILPVNDWANASGGAAPDTVSHTVGGIVVNFKCFDGANTEEAMVNFFEITHAIDIDSLNRATTPLLAEIHTHGMPSTNAAGVVKIFYDLVYMPVDAAPIAWGTFSNLITVSANQQYFHKLGGVELTKPTSGFNIGDKILVKYRRTPTDAQDTYTDDWIFSQCAMHMPLNSKGSRQRYVK